MKIGIIGRGTVGSAVFEGLEYLGHTMTFFDPRHEGSAMTHVLDTDVVFISVPTDQAANGDCDTSIVDNVVAELAVNNYRGLAAIKSTVIPGTTDRLHKQYPGLRLVTVKGCNGRHGLAYFIVGITNSAAPAPSGQRAVTVLTLVKKRTPSLPCWLASPKAERFQPPKL